jgi:2-amino-4-hydroxy-6-hydroxymethyldihydropteridine diphosphokinase
MNQEYHKVVILMGSNISPADNLKKAYFLLCSQCMVTDISQVWENAAFASSGPNFLNAAVNLVTSHSVAGLIDQVLHPIENQLGRIRTKDKNSPRTIDLDIIIFDNQVLDQNLWSRLHISLPVSELLPDLVNPYNGKTLAEIARSLQESSWTKRYPEVLRDFD